MSVGAMGDDTVQLMVKDEGMDAIIAVEAFVDATMPMHSSAHSSINLRDRCGDPPVDE